MRQQIEASPVSSGLAGKGGGNLDVIRRMQRGELYDQGAGRAQYALPITDDGDLACAVKIHRNRHAADDPVVINHRVGLVDHDRVVRLHWVLLVGNGEGEHCAVTDAEPNVTEVSMVPAPLPKSSGIADQLQ